MPVDTAGYENRRIEGFLGSPIPLFNAGIDPEDSKCVPLYNAFKPAILEFFNMCNHPTENGNKESLKAIMQEIHDLFGYIFLVRANIAGLCPPVSPTLEDHSWKEEWFTQLFEVPEDRRLSIVVQGGEAVNFYSMYKYTSVPTHDADTRILAGHHFNYLQDIATVPADIKKLMHQYRFFVAFGLSAFLNTSLMDLQDTNSPFLKQFIPNWPTDGRDKLIDHKSLFLPILNNKSFFLKVIIVGVPNPHVPAGVTPYDINDDMNLSRLISIDTDINFEGGLPQGPYDCSIVDLFVPHRVMSTNPLDFGRVGQSDSIHSYFSTDQAMSTVPVGAAPPNPAGLIPSLEFDLPFPGGISHIGPAITEEHPEKTIKLRIVPHGFIIFETLRMLLVSDTFLRYGRQNKFLKYKQKLVVLLSTLMREDLSKSIYTKCLGYKAQAPLNPEDEDLRTYLLGGKAAVESRKIEVEMNPLLATKPLPVKAMSTTTTDIETPKEINAARKFSRELFLRDSKGEHITAEGISKDDDEKWAGYFDFLSYTNPDFKDFRLPKSQKDLEEKKLESRLIQELLETTTATATTTQKPKSGYRRKTPRSRKTGRATRRK